MAYKVQIADANLRGSITAPKNVDVSVDLEGAVVSIGDDASVAGTVTVNTGEVKITDELVQYKGNSASGDKFIEFAHSSNNPSVKLHDNSNNHVDLQLDIDTNAGRIQAGDGGSFEGTLAASNGSFTGIDMHVSGNLNCAAIVLTDTNIRVSGSTSTTTGVASVKDSLIVLGSGSGQIQADMDGAGLLLGFDGTGGGADGGAGIVYRTSGTKFQVANLKGTLGDNKYSVKAKAFYGDGAGLTGFTFGGFGALIEPGSATTTSLAAGDVTKMFLASFNGSQTVNLPDASTLAAGDFYVFKNGRATNSKIILKTVTSGGVGQTIDGIDCSGAGPSDNITISDADAAFRIFTDGSNYFLE